jgi:hypothetical protein
MLLSVIAYSRDHRFRALLHGKRSHTDRKRRKSDAGAAKFFGDAQ